MKRPVCPSRINYFDLGLCRGHELAWMASFLPTLTDSYHLYGFEACREHFDRCVESCDAMKNVALYHKAIAGSAGIVRLYHSRSEQGHSIYASKNNVVASDFEEVEAIRFSDFFREHASEKEFNILRFNIEGAEWDLLNDLVESGLVSAIDLFGGSDEDDMAKVAELRDRRASRDELIQTHGIKIAYFCDVRRGWKESFGKIAKSEYARHLVSR